MRGYENNLQRIDGCLYEWVRKDIRQAEQEKLKETSELRPWASKLLKTFNKAIFNIKKCKPFKYLLAFIQIMMAIFAAVSTSGLAIFTLGTLGMGQMLKIVLTVGVVMASFSSNITTVIHKIYFGSKRDIKFCYQKMRMVEIKLFRSPYIPDNIGKKTSAIKQYMQFYNEEKWVFSEIRKMQQPGYTLDDKRMESVPTGLRILLLFSMYAQISSDPITNQRRIFREISKNYERYYSIFDSKENTSTLMDYYKKASSSDLTPDGPEFDQEQASQISDEKIAKVIVECSIKGFAHFARKHIEEQCQDLVNGEDNIWSTLSETEREEKKIKAFKWALKQHLKRQNKKIKNACMGNAKGVRFYSSILLFFTSIGPWGFSTLSSSPVRWIIGMLGKGWESTLCIWFWFCGAANQLSAKRGDVEKSWLSLCQYASNYLILKDRKDYDVKKKTWYFSRNNISRALLALLMACSSCVFTIFGINRLLKNPSNVGAEGVLSVIFISAMPWLRPIFIPLCAILCFHSAVLYCGRDAKYYAVEHMPMPKRECGQEEKKATGCLIDFIKRLVKKNLDFSKNAPIKTLKLFATCISCVQVLIFYVSAINICGQLISLLLIPSSFLAFNATNRKCVDSIGDFIHARYEPDCFKFDLKSHFREWFCLSKYKDPTRVLSVEKTLPLTLTPTPMTPNRQRTSSNDNKETGTPSSISGVGKCFDCETDRNEFGKRGKSFEGYDSDEDGFSQGGKSVLGGKSRAISPPVLIASG